jgi:hypothetical protein
LNIRSGRHLLSSLFTFTLVPCSCYSSRVFQEPTKELSDVEHCLLVRGLNAARRTLLLLGLAAAIVPD